MNTYSVIMQCLLYADKVANFTPADLAALDTHYTDLYHTCASDKTLIKERSQDISEKFLDVTDPDSVISHYAAFVENSKTNPLVYLNKGEFKNGRNLSK